jgi:hypothetical protein
VVTGVLARRVIRSSNGRNARCDSVWNNCCHDVPRPSFTSEYDKLHLFHFRFGPGWVCEREGMAFDSVTKLFFRPSRLNHFRFVTQSFALWAAFVRRCAAAHRVFVPLWPVPAEFRNSVRLSPLVLVQLCRSRWDGANPICLLRSR